MDQRLNNLIELYQARAYRFAFRLTSSESDAMDLVTQGFARLANTAETQTDGRNLVQLYRILVQGFLGKAKLDSQGVLDLDREQKALIVLFHSESQTYEQIAEVFGASTESIKARLNMARLAMSKKPAVNAASKPSSRNFTGVAVA